MRKTLTSEDFTVSIDHCSRRENRSTQLFFPIVLQTSPEVDCFAAHLIYSIRKSFSNNISSFSSSAHQVVPCLELIRLQKLSLSSNSSLYHYSLERKMRALTENIINSNYQSSNMMNWKLIMDVDAHVFPGWFEKLILPKIGWNLLQQNKNIDDDNVNHTSISRRLDDYVSTVSSKTRANDAKKTREFRKIETMYFQREGSRAKGGRRDKINTGVILLNVNNPMTRAIYLEANRTVERRKGGDQTAMQRVLRWYVDAPRILTEQPQRHPQKQVNASLSSSLIMKYANQLLPSSGDDDGKNKQLAMIRTFEDAFDYDVFDKQYVNAGVIDAQRDTVLIHHAHMSGAYKRENLEATYLYKTNASGDHPYFLLERHNKSLEIACREEHLKKEKSAKKFDVELVRTICELFGYEMINNEPKRKEDVTVAKMNNASVIAHEKNQAGGIAVNGKLFTIETNEVRFDLMIMLLLVGVLFMIVLMKMMKK